MRDRREETREEKRDWRGKEGGNNRFIEWDKAQASKAKRIFFSF